MKIFFPIIFLLSFTLSSFCEEEPNAFYLKRYSENQKYYVTTILYSNWDNNDFNRTYIKKSDNDSVLYSIDEYFDSFKDINNIFLSNDGSILAVISKEYFDNKEKIVIKIFNNGKLEKTIDLIDNEINNVAKKIKTFDFYSNENIRIAENYKFDKQKWEDSIWIERDYIYLPKADSSLIIADKFPTFVYNDTLFLITQNLILFKIAFKNFEIVRSNFQTDFFYLKKIAKQNKIIKQFEHIKQFIEIIDENPICDFLADSLKMKSTKGYSKLFKYHDLELNGYISKKDSIFHINYIEKDSCLPNVDYQNFLNSYKFDIKSFNPLYSKWYFGLIKLSFRNANDSIAKHEKSRENKIKDEIEYSNAFKDSINGIYIPKDLYEAMDELDKLVSDKNKRAIKDISNTKELLFGNSNVRFSMRYNWELWHNSRIAKYLNKFGIRHPEDMGCKIDCAYWYYLRDSSYFLVNFDNVKFKLDSNLFIQFNPNSSFDKNNFSALYCKKVIFDSLGRKILYPAFSRSELEDYLYWDDDSTEFNFKNTNSDYSIYPYIDSLNSRYYNFNNIRVPFDSCIFIKTVDYDLNKFINKLVNKTSRDKNQFAPFIESWQIVKYVSKNELDSLDQIFIQINRKIREDESKGWTYNYNSERNKVLFDYLANKRVMELNIIRLYPLIEFDFKKYKQEKKNK